MILKRLVKIVVIVAVFSTMVLFPVKADDDWFYNFVKKSGTAAIVRIAKNNLIMHLQNRSSTAINFVIRANKNCEGSREEFYKILPLATTAFKFACSSYDRPAPSESDRYIYFKGPQGVFGTLRLGIYSPPSSYLDAYQCGLGLLNDLGLKRREGRWKAPVIGVTIISFRGTQPLSPNDWWTNLTQMAGMFPKQYEWALLESKRQLARVLPDNKELVIFTGHSLGGGLATFVALSLKKAAITLNAAGLHPVLFKAAYNHDRLINEKPPIPMIDVKPDQIKNIYHFISHSEDGYTDIVGNVSFAGYSILPGAKYFINTGFVLGNKPSITQYARLHSHTKLYDRVKFIKKEKEKEKAKEGGSDKMACTELHGRDIYFGPY